MAHIDRERLQWIGRNLTITHDRLSREEARDWLRLMMRDKKSFESHATFGFVLRRQNEIKAKKISHAEVSEFLDEFAMKIQLANRTRKITVSFPLFEIVGSDILSKLGIIFEKTAVDPKEGAK